MKQGFSMIIVNYYSENYIEPLIRKIAPELQTTGYEFIIINNSPHNFSFSNSEINEYNIKLVDNDGNKGFGIGMNKGIKHSNYEYFYMINPDMVIEGSTLISMYNEFLTEDNNIGAVSCKILNTDLSLQNGTFSNKELKKITFLKHQFYLVVPSFLKKGSKSILNNNENKNLKVEVAGFYASFVLMKKEVFNLINGFDPDFFMYSEDIDLFRTRFPREYKCLLYNNFSVIHHSGGTDKFGLMDQQSQVSFLLYLIKNGYFYLFMYIFLHTPRYLLFFIISKLLNKDNIYKESKGYLKSLLYLPKIIKARKYGSLQNPLKINEIMD